LSLEDKIN